MNWTLDESFYSRHFDDTAFRFVSLCYICAGTLLLGFSAIYISQALIGNKDKWLTPVDDDSSAAWTTYVTTAIPNYKIHSAFLLWFTVGIFVFWGSQNWTFAIAFDYVISTLTGAGYRALNANSKNWQFALAALYCTVGVPLWDITIGKTNEYHDFYEVDNFEF